MLIKTVTGQDPGRSTGTDQRTASRRAASGQMRIPARKAVVPGFGSTDRWSLGHHLRGDGTGGADEASTDRGHDTIAFVGPQELGAIITGRIEIFDMAQHSLAMAGSAITLRPQRAGSNTTRGPGRAQPRLPASRSGVRAMPAPPAQISGPGNRAHNTGPE